MASIEVSDRRSRLGTTLVTAAIVLPAMILAGNAYLSWRQEWRDAEYEVGRTADTAAEYARRVLEGHRQRLDRVNDLLRGWSDADIRTREREFHDALRNLAPRDNTSALAIYVFDRDARPLVASNAYPVPPGPFPDRDFNDALRSRDAPTIHVSPIYVGSINRVPYFALSQRRTGTGNPAPQDGYDGFINVSIYATEASAALARIPDDERDVVNLIRADGQALARSAGLANLSFPARIYRTDEAATLMGQDAERLSGVGVAGLTTEDRRFTYRRVAGFPVYAMAARPLSVIAADWLRSMVPQLLIGVPAWLGLIALAWLVRRSQNELETRVESRTAALREGEQRLRLAHEAAGIGYWERDMKTGQTRWSPEMYALFGLDPVRDGPMGHGRYFSELVHPEDRERVQAAAREALQTGRYHCEYRVLRPRPDGGRELRWIMGRGVVADGKGGHVLLGANVDITERREAEEQEALLMQEVDHRAKNVLAVVLSLLRLTPRDDPAAFARAVEGRVLAMSRVHTLLAQRHWTFADLKEVVEAELRAYASPVAAADPRIAISGPRVRLAPTVAQSMSVVVHELATNAAKYGALSVPAGRVEVSWTLSNEVVELVWTERGGPHIVAPPARRGFGTRLIDATLRHQLGGEVSYDWAPFGLTAMLTVSTGLDVGGVAASAAD